MIGSVTYPIYKTLQVRHPSLTHRFHPYINFKSKGDEFSRTNYEIEPLQNKNLPEIYPIYLRYRQSANVESSISEVKDYLEHECIKSSDKIIVARENNKPIGFIHYGKELSTLRKGERLRLKALFIDEEYRRNGIATKLINALKTQAGNREVAVKARLTNIVSPQLYINCGFHVDEEYVHLVYKNNSDL